MAGLRVHHLDCATLCTFAPRFTGGAGLVCHCLLVETDAGLLLVDTGLGLADVHRPRERLGRGFLALARPRLAEAHTAVRQIERLGFRAADVRHVALTHLDLDHAGGLADFPHARVHLLAEEHAAAMRSATLVERLRYRPAQWAHAPRFELYRGRGERWFGFESVGALRGLPDDVLLVPLVGHTRGHTGVAVRDASGWMLHAGDAYMHHGTIDGGHVPTALRVMQRLDDMDRAARVANQRRVRTLAASGDARVFCAHDPSELAGYT